jgi:hypothetical protein
MSLCAKAEALVQTVLGEGSAKDFLKGLPKLPPPPPDSRRRVGDFSFSDRGIEHQQYFPGASTAFTDWDDVYIGIGDDPREAAGDALDQASEEWNTEGVEVPGEFGETPSVNDQINTQAKEQAESALSPEDYETDEEYAAAIDDFVEDYLEQNDFELSYYVLFYVREFDPERDHPVGIGESRPQDRKGVQELPPMTEGTAKAFLKSLRTTPREWPIFKRWGRRENDDVQSRRAFRTVNRWRAGQQVPVQKRLKHTRFYKYPQGRFAVRLHDTNVIFYDQDGTAHINVGAWRTKSSRNRINTFAPHGWRLEKYRYQWWWWNINWPETIRQQRWAKMRNYRRDTPLPTGPLWIPFTNNDRITPDGKLHAQQGEHDPRNPLGEAPAESLARLLPPLQEGRFLDKLDWIKRVRAKHRAMREVKKKMKDIEDLKKPDKKTKK